MRAHILVWITALAHAAAQEGAAPAFAPFDRAAFEAYLAARPQGQALLQRFQTAAAQGSLAAAVDEALRQTHAAYDQAVRLAQSGDPRAAVALTKQLVATDDPYLSAHCRYHLGRVFLDADDPEHAAAVFVDYLRSDRNRSPLDAEVAYFYGRALALMPDATAALPALQKFLEHFPDAPAAYRQSAAELVAKLEGRVGPLHEIADSMKFCEHRIRRAETGEDTQRRQEQVIGKLETLLEEVTQEEQATNSPTSADGEPEAPAESSSAPSGTSRIGDLRAVRSVADRWGQLQDRERRAIENDLQTKLPGRQRRMLEEYYRRLNAGGR